jgi:DNA-binding CsgD family transcriptional regulator
MTRAGSAQLHPDHSSMARTDDRSMLAESASRDLQRTRAVLAGSTCEAHVNAGTPLREVIQGDRSFPASQFLRRMLEGAVDRVLAVDAHGHRIYSSPSFDSMVGADGRLPLNTSAPPPYVPPDQHGAYFRLLDAVPQVLVQAETAYGHLVLLRAERNRCAVDVTVGGLVPPRGDALAVWLFAPRGTHDGGWRVRTNGTTRGTSHWRYLGLPRPDTPLTPRECEILDLLLEGWRVQSIAETLYLSVHTVRNHLKAIFRKLGTHSQKDLIEMVRSQQTST